MPILKSIYPITNPTILNAVVAAADYFHTDGLVMVKGRIYNSAGSGNVVVSIKNSVGTNVTFASLATGQSINLDVLCYGIRLTYSGAGAANASLYAQIL